MKTKIGLDAEKSEMLAKDLNQLIVYLHIFYMKVKVFQWNITGKKYFEVQLKFDKAYTDSIINKIDEVAERILVLGYFPDYSFSGYMKGEEVEAISGEARGSAAVREILESSEVILGIERKLLDLATACKDAGTAALMVEYIKNQEKYTWMFSAYL